MPFKPGQSGNPSGRPKVIKELQDLAREHTTEALSTLVDVMRDGAAPAAARVTAAQSILDRGYGKAPQKVEGDLSVRHSLVDILRAVGGRASDDLALEASSSALRNGGVAGHA